jgi:hypothetical protein
MRAVVRTDFGFGHHAGTIFYFLREKGLRLVGARVGWS